MQKHVSIIKGSDFITQENILAKIRLEWNRAVELPRYRGKGDNFDELLEKIGGISKKDLKELENVVGLVL